MQSGETTNTKAVRGDGDTKFTSTFETSCYRRILDSDNQLEQSSALLRDAQLVDRPHEVVYTSHTV